MIGFPTSLSSEFEAFTMIQAPSSQASSPTFSVRKGGTVYLPEGYTPGPYDVICQRGKDCHEHVGNRRFRACVEKHVDIYLSSTSRQEKSAVISNIVKLINENEENQFGGFVMRDNKTQRWHHVDSKVARDKVGNALRDAIKQRQEGRKPSEFVEEVVQPQIQQSSGQPTNGRMDTMSNVMSLSDQNLFVMSSTIDQEPRSHGAIRNDAIFNEEMTSAETLLNHLEQMKRNQPLGQLSMEQPFRCDSIQNFHRYRPIHQVPIDQSCFSISGGAHPGQWMDTTGGASSGSNSGFFAAVGPYLDTGRAQSSRLCIEAFTESMNIDDFDDLEPRPIRNMF